MYLVTLILVLQLDYIQNLNLFSEHNLNEQNANWLKYSIPVKVFIVNNLKIFL